MSQRTRTRDMIYDFLPPTPIPGGHYPPPPMPDLDDNENSGKLFFNTINDFPANGQYNVLYFNRDNNILYCWDNGAYVPISAHAISEEEDTVIDGGGVV